MGKIQWTIQVWLCRRFLRTMTVEKLAVLAHVTGIPLKAMAAMHPSCRLLAQAAMQ